MEKVAPAAAGAEVTDLSSPDATSKSREASAVASSALEGVLSQVAAGKRAVDLCKFGDSLIEQLTAPMYKSNKKLEKGIAFPTCISVNNCVAHYSPLESEDKIVLKDGDVVKMCVAAWAGRGGGEGQVRGGRRRSARGEEGWELGWHAPARSGAWRARSHFLRPPRPRPPLQ